MAARGTRRGVPCRNPGFADAISFESTDVSDFDMSAINRHHEQEHGHIDIRVNAAGRPQREPAGARRPFLELPGRLAGTRGKLQPRQRRPCAAGIDLRRQQS